MNELIEVLRAQRNTALDALAIAHAELALLRQQMQANPTDAGEAKPAE